MNHLSCCLIVFGTKQSDVIPKLTKNGLPVLAKDVDIVVKEDKIVITFKKPSRDDSGKYDFTLSNSQGEAKVPLNCNFVDVPGPPEGPLEVKDLFRDRCKLSWKPPKELGGLPLLHYVVERQDIGVRGGWTEVGTTEDLKIDVTDLAHKKEYKFRVRAVNKKGASEPLNSSKNIIAKDPYDEPSKVQDCELVDWDKEHVDLKWKPPEKDGGSPIEKYVVEMKDKFQSEWSQAIEVPGDKLKGKVCVPIIKEGNQYQFRVRAVNKAGPGEPSDPTKPVIIKDRFVKPFIVGEGLKNIVVKKGANIKYDIQFKGEPPPEVVWDTNDNELKSSSRVSIENTDKTTLLIIKQAVRADSGKFRLTLTNSSGTCTSTADVVVLDKPSMPQGPLLVEDVHAEHCKLKWKEPKDDGGTDLKGYLIEKQDVDSGRWIPLAEVGPNVRDYKCEGLTKGKKYKFRVKAVNKEGESEPLETLAPILAKNPYDEPGPPGKPEIVDYDNTKVDLKWTPPQNDGGRPVEKYIVEMKEKNAQDWRQVVVTEGPTPEATVPRLKANSVLQFRVRAINIAGNGEPSEPTEPHLVKHRNLKPQIDRTNLKNITLKAGRSHKFEVDVIGEPAPEIRWTFKEEKLSDSENVKIDTKEYHTDLQLMKMKRKQTGKYTITATNRNGTDSVTVEVNVLSAPSKPEGPLEVEDVHKEGCKLKWKKPKDDGGVPIDHYEVEKMDKETGRWTRVGKAPANKPEIEVTGLTPGHEYQFRVVAVNDEGESEPLVTDRGTLARNPYDEPGKPGTPDIVDYDNTSVDLKWQPPKKDGGSPILKYIIEKKEKNALQWEKATEVPGSQLEGKVADLIERQEMQFRVVAVNKAGPGEPSDATKMHTVKFRRLKPYIDRTNLEEVITIKRGKQLKLDVNVRGEPPPKITWKLVEKVITNDQHYDIVNVDYNTKFTINDSQRMHTGKYMIIAENEVGRDQAQVEICVLAAPSRPKGPLKVENVTAKSADVKWQKPEDDGGKPIKGYLIEKLDPNSGQWVPCGKADKDATDFTVTGLQKGKQYKFRVKALNDEGESEPLVCTEPIIAKDPYEVADAPGQPKIDDWDEKKVDLKWTPPKNDGGAPITGYIVEMKDKNSTQWIPVLETQSPAAQATVEGLTKGKQVQFRVKAKNKAGESEPSQPSAMHTVKERHLAPKINRDTLKPITIRSGGTAKLDVEISGEPPPAVTWTFDGKKLFDDNNTKIENPDYESHLQIRHMTRAQSGKYTITAENESGKDVAEVEIKVLDRPSKPEGPLDVSDVHAEGCKLQWRPPKDDGGVPIENYVVEKKDSQTGRWVPCAKVGPSDTECKVTGLDQGKKYEFRVKAVNPEGDSDYLDTDRSTLAKNPYEEPGQPGMPTIEDWDKNWAQLKWEPPIRDGGAPITGYIIEKKDKYSPDWVQAAVIDGNICQGKVKGLHEGDKYEFRIRAVNKAGAGAPSESVGPHLAKTRWLKPQIDRTNMQPITVKVGQMVFMDVNVIGEPAPKTVWSFKGEELKTNEVYNINDVDYNTKFTLNRATRKTRGVYTLTAKNEVGEDTAEVEIKVLGKPSKPQGPLEVSDVHKEGCTLKWKPPEDDGGCPIECYEVEKMDEETGRWVPCGKAGPNDTKLKVNNLVPGKKYQFRVRACNKEGDSEELETDTATLAKNPFDEPDKPGRPEPIDWDSDHVDLAWKPPENDGGAPIEKYVVEKRKKGTHKWHKAKETKGPEPSVTVDGLEEGEQYEFRVIAVNKAGPSEPSDPSRTVIAKPRKLAPIIDRINLKNIKIRAGQPVKFDVDVKGEPEPTIEWSFKDEKLKSDDHHKIENEPYHTLFMLINSKREDTGIYRILAKNEHGTDEAEVEITVTSKPSKPEGPLDVSDVHAEGCKLKWKKPEDDGGEPILNYQIEKQDTETGRWVPVCTSREPEADITGLIPGHEYKFRVKAVNAEGESEPLETDHATVAKNPFTEPDKPGKPQVVDWDRHHVDLKWESPKDDGGAPITGYIIEKKEKTGKNWSKALVVDGPITEARVPDLIEGVDYQFRVKAVNKAGPGGPSDASEVVTTKPRHLLPKIEHVRDITVHAGQPIKLDVKVIGEPPPKTMWYRGDDDKPLSSGSDLKIENEPYRTKLMVPNAKRSDTGMYKLVASNPSGTDEAEVKVTVLDKPAEPEGPLDVSDVHAEGCKLKWKPPKDDGGVPIEAYVVEKQDQATGKWVPVCQTTTPEANISNLEPGHEYKFRVKAVNAEGESAPLVTLEPTLAKNPYDPPGAPGTPKVTDVDKNHVDLQWEPPAKDGGAPISGYIIEKKEKGSDKWVKACQIPGDDTKARVPDLETGHEYQFRVKAVNKAGPGAPSDETKMVLVKHKKLAPKIDRKNLRPIKIKVGQEFVFDADVIGEPVPEVVWKLKDKMVSDKANLTITNKPHHTRLECDKATRKDAGVYHVIATNKWGEDQADIEVKIVGKPSKPKGPLQVEDIRKDGCTLKWEKPDDDGGEPLEGYLVEKLDPETGSWIPVGKTFIPEMNVNNLMPGKQYSFRVKAINKEGESEPLETLSPIIAKDPYETPGQPGRPEPVDWNKDHVDLKWEPPANDGGAPIESYIIEKRERGSGRWMKAAEVPGDHTRGTAPNLEEGKEYEFRVTAVNKAGPGEPSEASKSVVAKPRFRKYKLFDYLYSY